MMRWFFKTFYEKEVIPYTPKKIQEPNLLIKDKPSAWQGLESIIEDIMEQFGLDNKLCMEFGVEFGYSAVAFSNFFEKVIGIDTFMGDEHTHHKGNHFEDTSKRLSPYKNIELIKSDYQNYTKDKDDIKADLIHVDIIHNYKHTFACGLWSAKHSKCTIFHDTESFPQVRWAVRDIAKATNKKFYNFPKYNGLGIVA